MHDETNGEQHARPDSDPVLAPVSTEKRRNWAAMAFPVLLWAFATYYYPDLGKWEDDYVNAAHNHDTGEYKLDAFAGYLWDHLRDPYRPLCHALNTAKATLLQHYDWINHFINVATHALATWLVWWFFRRFARGWHAPAAAAVIFLVFPLGHQVILCSSGQPTSLATVTFLLIAAIYMKFARREWGWFSVLPMAVLTYTLPMWQEQPATTLLVLPLLYLAACPRTERWGVRILRCLTPVFVSGMTMLAYVVRWQMAPKAGLKGGPGSWLSLEEIPDKVVQVVRRVVEYYRMEDILSAGFPLGWERIGSLVGFTWIVLLAVSLYGWWRQWHARPIRAEVHDDAPGARAKALGIIFAVSAIVLAWLPLFLQRWVTVESRMCYYPLVHMLLIAVILLDTVAGWLNRLPFGARAFKMSLGVGVVWSGLYLAICFVGIQSLYLQRHRLDMDQLAQLRSLVPDPKPYTVFVPLDVRDQPARTGRVWFDHTVRGVFEMDWVVTPVLRQTYKMGPLFGTHFIRWLPTPLRDADGSSIRYEIDRDLDRYFTLRFEHAPAGGVRIPWQNMIPFVVDQEGRVHLVSIVHVDQGGKGTFDVTCPRAVDALRKNKLPERTFTLENPDAFAGMPELTGWRWVETGEPAKIDQITNWGKVTAPCIGMHSPYAGQTERRAIATELASSSTPSRIYFRAGFGQWDLENREWGDGVEVRWYLEGQRDNPLCNLHISPEQIAKRKRWIPVSLEIPALSQPRDLIVEIGPGPKGNCNYDACWVTVGYREELGKGSGQASQPTTQTTRPGK